METVFVLFGCLKIFNNFGNKFGKFFIIGLLPEKIFHNSVQPSIRNHFNNTNFNMSMMSLLLTNSFSSS